MLKTIGTIAVMALGMTGLASAGWFESVTTTPETPVAGENFEIRASYWYIWSGDTYEDPVCTVDGDTIRMHVDGETASVYGYSEYFNISFNSNITVPAGDYTVIATCDYWTLVDIGVWGWQYSSFETGIQVAPSTPASSSTWSSIKSVFR